MTRPASDEPATNEVDAAETRRIRDVYAARDRRPVRSAGIQRAYALLNDERREVTVGLIRDLTGELGDRFPSILDVGCGGGLDLADLLGRGWPAGRLAGVDLVAERIAIAREQCPGVRLELGDGAHLPFADGSFAIATAVTVFSSILDAGRRRALFEDMTRVVAPGGHVIVYDFVIRSPRNRNVVAMPMSDLVAMASRAPDRSIRLSPFLYAVAGVSMFGSAATSVAMRLAPRTHRLSAWRRPPQAEPATS
jgi:SAM-dependent methyltransferase